MAKTFHIFLCYRSFFASILAILLVFFLSFEGVEAKVLQKSGISIIIPNKSSQYLKIVTSIQNNLKVTNNREAIDVVDLSNFRKVQSSNLDNKKLVVLIGSKSFNYFNQSKSKSPYLSSLITRNAFDYFFSQIENKSGFIGGVTIDQPASRFVALANSIVPNLEKAGIVLGPEVVKTKSLISKDISKFKLDVNWVEVLLSDNPVNKLRQAYQTNEAIILFPDKKEFNNKLSRWILTLSYQYKIPLISYSKKYAKAGALASLFSTAEQIGEQTAEMISAFLRNPNNKPKKLVAPKHFDIYINESVERALNLRIPSKLELLKKLSKQ